MVGIDNLLKSLRPEGRTLLLLPFIPLEVQIFRRSLYRLLNQLTDDDPITVLVGPEGDFSIDEVKLAMAKGYKSISLGKSRLRTETAGLYAVMLAQLAKRK